MCANGSQGISQPRIQDGPDFSAKAAAPHRYRKMHWTAAVNRRLPLRVRTEMRPLVSWVSSVSAKDRPGQAY